MDLREQYFLPLIGSQSVVAEIGVWKGEFSEVFLKKNPKKLYLIDPWKFRTEKRYSKFMYGGNRAKNQSDMDDIYKEVLDKVSHKENVQIVRKMSEDAVELIQDLELDFLFIDGDHTYDGAIKDLNNYFSKVKRGGYITVDDYNWESVRKAVSDFIKKNPDLLIVKHEDLRFILFQKA